MPQTVHWSWLCSFRILFTDCPLPDDRRPHILYSSGFGRPDSNMRWCSAHWPPDGDPAGPSLFNFLSGAKCGARRLTTGPWKLQYYYFCPCFLFTSLLQLSSVPHPFSLTSSCSSGFAKIPFFVTYRCSVFSWCPAVAAALPSYLFWCDFSALFLRFQRFPSFGSGISRLSFLMLVLLRWWFNERARTLCFLPYTLG